MSKPLAAKVSSCCPSVEDIRASFCYVMIFFSVDHSESFAHKEP